MLNDNLIDDRDRAVDAADKLAAALAGLLGVEIGEHSPHNDAWQNALSAAEAALAGEPGIEWAAEYTQFDGGVRRKPTTDRGHAELVVDGVRTYLSTLNEPTRQMSGIDRVHIVSRRTRSLPDGTKILGPWVRDEQGTPGEVSSDAASVAG